MDEFKQHASKASKVAVFEEIPAGNLTPVIIYHLLKQFYQDEGVILENLHQDEGPRYAYICFEPMTSLLIPYGSQLNPLDALRDIKSRLNYSTRQEASHLITKAIGFITYDAASSFENINEFNTHGNTLPLCLFHFFALNITFDYNNKTVLISLIVDVNEQIYAAYIQGKKKIQNIIKLFANSAATLKLSIKKKSLSHIETDISDDDFMQMVKKAKEYIIQGDAFQIVISRRFKRSYTVSPFDIYQTLREVNPAPFMFYFPTESQTIIGASPERLVRVYNNEVIVNPIAGTRKRHGDLSDDDICIDLLNDKKELAEHMMLVDLARNDVGAVSKPGSVKVNELLKIKHYSHISHITSTITGQLQKNKDALEALKSASPAGTLSGAPKIRAMQIIAELEKSPRGLYGGAICRFDLSDNLDSCIAIRMAVLEEGIATIRTGAGIVYDSDPYSEAQETRQKAHGILDAIAKAHGE